MFKFSLRLLVICGLALAYIAQQQSVVATPQQYTDATQQQRYPNPYQQHYVQKYQNEYQQQSPQQQQEPPRYTRYSGGSRQQQTLQQQPPEQVDNRQSAQQAGTASTRYRNNQRPAQLNHHPARSNGSALSANLNKCKFWVPLDVVERYPYTRKIQEDKSNHLYLIEVCCTGYGRWKRGGVHFCRPICENCFNGQCLSPGECQCYEEFVANDNGDCVFTCPLGCLNGRCFLDGSCQCDAGYKLDESRKFCRPICSTGCGQNSRHNCTEPEVCGCAKGYQLSDEGCQPTCEPDCGAGGYCREYNQCECEVGYHLSEDVCQSDCYQKCDNGICYGRNRCICNVGYTYHERSTQCVPV